MAGHVVIGFAALTPAIAQVNAGTIRALAVTTSRRSAALPNVPTLKEAGLPNQESDTMTGILVPSGTPAAVIALLNLEVTKALSDPDVKSHLTTLGVDIVGSTPAEFESRIEAELSKWSGVIRQAHLSAE
jgi:tripartite-type tricarboxylate transporter receptor subunit TctC